MVKQVVSNFFLSTISDENKAHTCNPNIWEVETGGLGVQGQPGLYSQILSENNKYKQCRGLEM
jgi:hypothetical protein